jgi:predicted naringenin-chalcone synthase
MLLTRFTPSPTRHAIPQADSQSWIARAHAIAAGDAALGERIARVLARVPFQIDTRGHSVDEIAAGRWDGGIYDVAREPHGRAMGARTDVYAAIVDRYFEEAFAFEDAPDDLVHVTCTGYVSPSGAQKLVAARQWETRVTHAYHMGCYAAIPVVRMAAGMLATGSRRVDIAHTELCSLPLDPTEHALEQLVVQSLFADGLIRYAAVPGGSGGLRVHALHERILPDSTSAMSWRVGDHSMRMTLARDVPDRIADVLRDFVTTLYHRASFDLGRVRDSVFAVHPGGPKILDRVQDLLELAPAQIEASRAVLRAHGNMSSATLPHVWARIVEDDRVPVGTPITSLAFGPGLTVCGALLEKR